ncbi:MAG: long-chain fatty acid--CoA ligase [Acidobacteriota bacterium]
MNPARDDISVRTLAEVPAFVAAAYDKPVQVRRSVGDGYVEWSGRQFFEDVRAFSVGLQDAGVAPGDRVAIVCESRPEWCIADYAILSAGALTVPVYPTLSATQTQIILADAGASVAAVADAEQAEKVLSVASHLPALRSIVVIAPDDGDCLPAHTVVRVEAMAAITERGRARLAAEPSVAERVRSFVDGLDPASPATIIYTSGTTGTPKGVVLTHANILSNIVASNEVLCATADDTALSFLPLSHIFERMALNLFLCAGGTVVFAESLQTVGRDLEKVRPTLMTGVPRVYEKFHAAVLERVASAPPVRQRLFRWALGVGQAMANARLAGETPSLSVRLKHPVADALVLRKVREGTGGRLRTMVSGSAPLSVSTAEFFYAVGLRLIEGYGLTETSPVITINPLDAPRLGKVGTPISGVDIRIAGDGEILVRGPNITPGYYNRPDETAQAIEGGWFHTGDVGEIDADGYLTITDRKKDLIVTSGGKNIAPQPIEQRLKASPLIAEAILVGDRRNFPAALIVPDFAVLEAKLRPAGVACGSRDELVARADVQAWFQALIDDINGELAQFERIKRFAVLPSDLTVEGGELTPTMKLRRRVMEQRWAPVIDALYAKEAAAGPA